MTYSLTLSLSLFLSTCCQLTQVRAENNSLLKVCTACIVEFNPSAARSRTSSVSSVSSTGELRTSHPNTPRSATPTYVSIPYKTWEAFKLIKLDKLKNWIRQMTLLLVYKTLLDVLRLLKADLTSLTIALPKLKMHLLVSELILRLLQIHLHSSSMKSRIGNKSFK